MSHVFYEASRSFLGRENRLLQHLAGIGSCSLAFPAKKTPGLELSLIVSKASDHHV